MNYSIIISLIVLWLATLLNFLIVLRSKKRISDTLDELYVEFGSSREEWNLAKLKMQAQFDKEKLELQRKAETYEDFLSNKDSVELALINARIRISLLELIGLFRCDRCGRFIPKGKVNWGILNQPLCDKHKEENGG